VATAATRSTSAGDGPPFAITAARTVPAAVARAPWTWTDVFPVLVLLLPLSYGVQYVTVAAVKWVLGRVALNTRRPIEALVSDITAYGALFLLVLLFVKVRRHASLAALGIRRAQWRWLVAALPFIVLAFLLESITGLLSQSLFPQTPANQCVDIRTAYQGALWMAIIGVAIVAPVVEEIVFRGMVFGWLRGRLPLVWAVVVSAALFSLEHIGFLQVTLFLPIFSTGIVLAILYHHARSVWPTVLVHGSFNLIATLVLFSTLSC
jgi:membrane protease YdiL (CAAX protease family)